MAHLQLGLDAYSPREISEKIQSVGVSKARLPFVQTAMLGVLAGGFIGLGALYFTIVVSDSTLGFAATRVLGGLVFSLGLILVSVAGAELFTGNNLVAMAWASRLVTFRELLRSWAIVYAGNLVGALGTMALIVVGRVQEFAGGAIGEEPLRLRSASVKIAPVSHSNGTETT